MLVPPPLQTQLGDEYTLFLLVDREDKPTVALLPKGAGSERISRFTEVGLHAERTKVEQSVNCWLESQSLRAPHAWGERGACTSQCEPRALPDRVLASGGACILFTPSLASRHRLAALWDSASASLGVE